MEEQRHKGGTLAPRGVASILFEPASSISKCSLLGTQSNLD